jgi:hypothetical protein
MSVVSPRARAHPDPRIRRRRILDRSAEGIPNTSFSKQGHRYGAVYQLSHDGPPSTLTLCRYGKEGRQVIGWADGEGLSATTLPLTG